MMITVTVRYHNLLRRGAGLEKETLTLPKDASLRDAFLHLAQRHGSPLREMLLDPEGGISLHLVVFRDDQLVRPDQHDASLSDGQELMLFPAISGG